MRYIKFGEKEIPLSVIGYGTSGMKHNSRDLNGILISSALDNGINFIDTAEQYGDGYSEKIVGETICNRRDEVFISTKVSPHHLRYSDVIVSLEQSLRRLKTDYIDLYQIHVPNGDIPIEETMDALCYLQDLGKIFNIGVSNFSLTQLKSLVNLYPGKIASIQRSYNIIEKEIDNELRSFCYDNNINIIAFNIFDQSNIHNNLDFSVIKHLCQKYNMLLYQLCINFVISQEKSLAVFGTSSLPHMKKNLSGIETAFSAYDVDYIKSFVKDSKCLIKPSQINVNWRGRQRKKVYLTLEEAKNNIYDYCPSPFSVANDIKSGESIFPVKVSMSEDKDKYNLMDGMVYFWGWVIAYGTEKKMEVYVRNI